MLTSLSKPIPQSMFADGKLYTLPFATLQLGNELQQAFRFHLKLPHAKFGLVQGKQREKKETKIFF